MRNEIQNPLVLDSNGKVFYQVGYPTGGTPMPVNVVAGGAGGGLSQIQERDSTGAWADVGYVAGLGTPLAVNVVAGNLTGADSVNGTVNVKMGTLNTVTLVGTLGTLYYVAGLGMGTVRVELGTIGINQGTLNEVYKIGTVYAGSICVTSGTVAANPTMGTLNTVTQIGTLPTLGTMGTLYYVTGLGMGTVRVESGTIGVNAGTVKLSANSGVDIGDVDVASGTIGVSMGTLQSVTTVTTVTNVTNLPTLGTMGTLYYVTGLGMGTVRVETGTVIPAGLGTVRVDLGTIGVSMGTLQAVTTCGTMGTLWYQNNLGTLYNLKWITAGTISTLQSGTLNTLNSGTLNTLNSGTLSYLGTFGLGTVRVDLGTIGISAGTLGTVNVFTKHDLHNYDSISTVSTTIGSIAQTASKIIKVHYYHLQTDGTWGVSWVDNKNGGGTVDYGWILNQREGVTTAFIPYPGYLFKTLTVGSALFLGSYPAFPCVGTLRATVVYTDDDTA